MNKIPFKTDQAPQAIGPYSQAIESHGFLFISGQIPIDPTTNQVIGSGSIEDQTIRVLTNIEALLKAKGLTMENIVKTTIFLQDMAHFQTANQIYANYFKKNPPARSTVEVSRLPKDALIEIEAIATCS